MGENRQRAALFSSFGVLVLGLAASLLVWRVDLNSLLSALWLTFFGVLLLVVGRGLWTGSDV